MKSTLAATLNPTADASVVDTLTGEVDIDYPIVGKRSHFRYCKSTTQWLAAYKHSQWDDIHYCS
jgi:hypothetical protein